MCLLYRCLYGKEFDCGVCRVPCLQWRLHFLTVFRQTSPIESGFDENTGMSQIEDCMICWSCKELFYWKFWHTIYTLKRSFERIQPLGWFNKTSQVSWRENVENRLWEQTQGLCSCMRFFASGQSEWAWCSPTKVMAWTSRLKCVIRSAI